MPADPPLTLPAAPRRVLLLGATGTIGRATAAALQAAGHDLVCLIRPGSPARLQDLPGATLRFGDATNPLSLTRDGFAGEGFDAVVSCLASRTGAPKDAWAIDHAAHLAILAAARAHGTPQMILLSALCVQRPLLAFQQAKLAFEQALIASGLTYSIVRPTAFFKSLSGQLARVQKGQPYLMFGDGKGTACKPISDRDLGTYLARCLTDPMLQNRILPIGGPAPALTPRDQGELIFSLLGTPPRFRSVPVRLLDAIVGGLSLAGMVSAKAAAKAELARIGRYYATQSMLVLNPDTGLYDADLTPSTGSDTLADHYRGMLDGSVTVDRGDHAVF